MSVKGFQSIQTRLPTTREDWHLMGRTIRLVLTIPLYTIAAIIAAVTALTVFVMSLNVQLVSDLIIGGALPPTDRLTVLVELYPFIGTSFGPLSGVLLLIVSILTGVNVAMAGYHVREHELTVAGGGASMLGVVFGTLGAGCAACGSAVLLSVLGLFGISTSLLFLPLDGLEFALLALVVITLSIHWLADGMRGGMVNGCPVDI
ncbi:hypothetical protein [Haloquadratum walsbyi]|jgi:hypothetical protein|uniref:Uncharacterized protein n=1 Tax=Haloquadratum walsbyi J07HQW2 TaxID=1238425 RepID=U1PS73_9EURY|nr:hypothetical protein [Haloquadratum walsbyi]ERG96642.1 MAG: hypothetical protein J07HQW2_03124 [Haloquadratum walsbyi J07HQW2]